MVWTRPEAPAPRATSLVRSSSLTSLISLPRFKSEMRSLDGFGEPLGRRLSRGKGWREGGEGDKQQT